MNYKCPVCGSTDCREFGVYRDSVRCNLCGVTDSPKQFDPGDAFPAQAFGHVTYEKDRYPNLHAAGLTGMVVDGSRITMHGRDLTLEDFKRIGRVVFNVDVVPRPLAEAE
jgi:transcription initiation factor TFIIIB Brf1 subunit/transcription initiation factor TFIIB